LVWVAVAIILHTRLIPRIMDILPIIMRRRQRWFMRPRRNLWFMRRRQRCLPTKHRQPL
jgi:hypothetical protein